ADYHVHAPLVRIRDRVVRGGAAIVRHQQTRPDRFGAFDRAAAQPVAVFHAIGNERSDLPSQPAQDAGPESRGGDSVDVVVAEDQDRLTTGQGGVDAAHGALAVA